MSLKREKIIKEIADNLAFLSKSTSLKNALGLFDSNRIAQDFFCGLFSLVFKYNNLINLDKLNDSSVNYPAIDLGDEKAKIAFQITTKKDSQKIKDTITKFIQHKLYNKYDKLIIFIIGEKQNSYNVDFSTDNKFCFDKQTDIWDDDYLIKAIDRIEQVDILEKISKFLTEQLIEYKFPEHMFPQDIKSCIEILKRDFGNITQINTLCIPSREDNFIENIKNPLNNMSMEFFQKHIRGHVAVYSEDILSFLQDERNNKIRSDYLIVAESIQQFYNENANQYGSIELLLRDVFDKVNILYDDNLNNKTKIKILLHNMYFNCDIGKNT